MASISRAKMSLGKSTDSWITGHLADGIGVHGKQQGLTAHSSCCQSCLNPRMTGSNYNDIVMFLINKH